MNDERLRKRLFYGVVAKGSRRQGGQMRRYKDTLKTSLKQLQLNPVNWEDLTRNRPAWRTKKTGEAIYEVKKIVAAKAKGVARNSPAPRADAKPSQHARTANAPSARESAYSDAFGRNAATIRPLQLLPTLLWRPQRLSPSYGPHPNTRHLIPPPSQSLPPPSSLAMRTWS
ncbi:unnamed protein product [Schistocephalus solidus]|uniref:Uncharacterized protein n=1 Tax=Schistocephalus solidus TaxID=70667 RepID=A0A183T620_SCHSO|nr:unnamed protein product [Schistocephalus solidus]